NPTFTLLYFGIVRPYKGIPILVEALEQLVEHNILTYIVGEWWMHAPATLAHIRTGPASSSIRLIDQFVDDAAMAELFKNCDSVVLPYLSATGSAVAGLATQFERPLIASQVGSLAHWVTPQTGVLVQPNNAQSLAAGILKMKSLLASGHDFGPALKAHKQAHSWEAYVDAVLSPSPNALTTPL
ncbi:MAG TPA: glycosyltransferase, partial [Opitutales bacterium]|nr:glycosyltransferase [Opitutales bacterium]